MLEHYIENSIADVQALLAITREDIKDIKEANHQAVFSRIKPKEELVDSFFQKKEQAKQIIQDLASQQPEAEIREIIGENAVVLFDQLNGHLVELKNENLHFAKLSIAVSEFYRSLLDNMIPTQSDYNGKKASPDAQFISFDA